MESTKNDKLFHEDFDLIIIIPPISEMMFSPATSAPINIKIPDIEGYIQRIIAPSIVITPPIIITI